MYNQKVSLSREIWDSDSHFDDNDETLRCPVMWNYVQNLTSLDITLNHLKPE